MKEAQAQRLGQLILRARTRRGWSLEMLHEHTGIPSVWLNRVERGVYLQPAPERLAKLAEALDIDPLAIDRASQNHLAHSLPSVRTYFRSTAKATPEQLDEIEAAVADIQAKHGAAELVFQVLSERHERGSLIVTTNLPFGEWTKVFPDARLAKAVHRPPHAPRAHHRHRHRVLALAPRPQPQDQDRHLTPAATARASYRRYASPSGLGSATTARSNTTPTSGKINNNTNQRKVGPTSSRRAGAKRSRRTQ